MKKIKLIISLIIIILINLFINNIVYANDYCYEILLKANNNNKLQKGDQCYIEISVNNISLKDGILLYNGVLEYDSNIIDVEILGSKDWELYYRKNNNITLSRKDLENNKEDQIIGKMLITAKSDIELNNSVKLVKNEVTDAKQIYNLKDVLLEITEEITKDDDKDS